MVDSSKHSTSSSSSNQFQQDELPDRLRSNISRQNSFNDLSINSQTDDSLNQTTTLSPRTTLPAPIVNRPRSSSYISAVDQQYEKQTRLDDLLAVVPVEDSILDNLDLKSFLKLSSTSKKLDEQFAPSRRLVAQFKANTDFKEFANTFEQARGSFPKATRTKFTDDMCKDDPNADHARDIVVKKRRKAGTEQENKDNKIRLREHKTVTTMVARNMILNASSWWLSGDPISNHIDYGYAEGEKMRKAETASDRLKSRLDVTRSELKDWQNSIR